MVHHDFFLGLLNLGRTSRVNPGNKAVICDIKEHIIIFNEGIERRTDPHVHVDANIPEQRLSIMPERWVLRR